MIMMTSAEVGRKEKNKKCEGEERDIPPSTPDRTKRKRRSLDTRNGPGRKEGAGIEEPRAWTGRRERQDMNMRNGGART